MQNFIPTQTGLNHETTLLITQSHTGACGVDLPEVPDFKIKTDTKKRKSIL